VSGAVTAERHPAEGGRLAAGVRRLRGPLPVCLAAAFLASLALLLVFDSHLTFYGDDWWFLIYRRGWSPAVFLDPHLDHIAIAPILAYKVLVAIFGMRSAMPFHVLATLVFALGAGLLFAYVRRRVGRWLALMGAALILFFGPSWIDLLWAFQLGYFGSIAAGLGALLALDRDQRAGDVLACVLLVVAISFSELGIPFAIGALVAVALRRPLRPGRLYVALVPLGLYAVWWLGWGHTAKSLFSLHNVANSPGYVIDAAAAGISALVGLTTSLDGNPASSAALGWGRPLLLAAVLLAGWRLWRLRGVPRGVWVAVAIGATFWFGAAFNTGIGRPPDNGRYLYPSAVFVVLIAAEVLRGATLRTRGLLAAGAITAAALVSNLAALHDGYKYWKGGNDQVRADLAALEVARPAVKPGYTLGPQISGIWLLPVNAKAYYSAVDAFGSPAYTQSQLRSRSEAEREEADRVLAAAVGLGLRPARGSAPGPCRVVPASRGGRAALTLGAGRATLEARGAAPIAVSAGRFSARAPVDLGPLKPGRAVSLTIPADRSTRPWHLGLRGYGAVRVCGAGAA
jgi:hypothetical protein